MAAVRRRRLFAVLCPLLDDIQANGNAYRLGCGNFGKYFYPTRTQAEALARMYTSVGEFWMVGHLLAYLLAYGVRRLAPDTVDAPAPTLADAHG